MQQNLSRKAGELGCQQVINRCDKTGVEDLRVKSCFKGLEAKKCLLEGASLK